MKLFQKGKLEWYLNFEVNYNLYSSFLENYNINKVYEIEE
jgi:hypothetical protein